MVTLVALGALDFRPAKISRVIFLRLLLMRDRFIFSDSEHMSESHVTRRHLTAATTMSINVQLHEDVVPYLVSPYESFFFLMDHVKLTVESGSGYPGEGGCFYGHTGRCYVSQYRVVVVSDPNVRTAYRSFSLPFYCIRDWSFSVGWLGAQTWRGHVNPVPGGGLIGVGRFSLQFLSHGFEEFRRHLEPVLEGSRLLFQRFSRLEAPSVLLLPGKLPGQADDDGSKRIAYCAPADPFTLYILADAESS